MAFVDENDNDTFFDGLSFGGSYSVAANGRGTATATTSNGTSSFVFWFWTPGKAQFLESDTFAAASGDLLGQGGLPFSTSSLSGPYAFTLAGTSGGNPEAALGRTLLKSGVFSGQEDADVGGSLFPSVALTGSYSVAANGRGTASVADSFGTTPLRIHLIDNTTAIFIAATGSEATIGLAEKQCSDCH